MQKNIFGENLISCCKNPITGFYRDGLCKTNQEDISSHVICSVVTTKFLKFSKKIGNDLSTPIDYFKFPGLKDGDKWCLCALRWKEAFNNNCAPKVILEATNIKALEYVNINDLILHQF